jgi:IPT/TIG domain
MNAMKNIVKRILGLGLLLATVTWSCSDDESMSPSAQEVFPPQGASNELLTVTGKDLSKIVTIYFEKENIQAIFNPNFNSDKAILFRVPADAVPGNQNIIFTNKDGTEFSIPFNVLGFANIISVSNYNFSENDEIVLTGKNLDDVTSVVFTGTTTELEVISKTATTLTVKFPATTLTESTLEITNAAGLSRTTQSFVAIDNAFKIFTDNYAPGYQDASWGSGGAISTTEFKSGTASVYKDYAAGNWHQLGFGWTNTPNDNYKYLSFWIKGASATYDLYITTSASKSGFASFDSNTRITVPANDWTYFKIPVATLDLWSTASEWNQIGWRIQGPDGQDERFYLDDVILVK